MIGVNLGSMFGACFGDDSGMIGHVLGMRWVVLGMLWLYFGYVLGTLCLIIGIVDIVDS